MILRRLKHKLSFSYADRNALLGPHSYPLMPHAKNRFDIGEVLEQYAHIEHTPHTPETPLIESFGRISNIRRAGKNLAFVDVVYNDQKIQVVVNFQKMLDKDQDKLLLLRKGDAIKLEGQPWRTRAGELSVLANKVPTLLSACLHPPPLSDVSDAIKRKNRVAELKAFDEARAILKTRDEIVSSISEFFRGRKFTQVQTPILSAQVGGANATPFVTKSGPVLRVAPELYLKRLIIGGFEKVFEIGPSFRDEGVDATHNPEFTTCEFYQTFATLEDLVQTTKELFEFVAARLNPSSPRHFDWQVVDFFSEIERTKQLPADLTQKDLQGYMSSLGIDFDPAADAPKLLDQIASVLIEEKCKQPTFIINHPAVLAPLAKQTTATINGTKREISRRFELIIDGREYVNAYEEENDPAVQLAKLQAQAQSTEIADLDYVQDMEWGLPPTGGWGMGIDRLVMLFTNSSRINQVIAFTR